MDWLWAGIFFTAAATWLVLKQLAFVRPGIAREFLKQGAKVIDVRRTDEFQSGHLPPAINIPLDELRQRITREVPNKETVLLLHCLGGVRSGMGKKVLRKMGYTNVFNLGSYGRARKIVRNSDG